MAQLYTLKHKDWSKLRTNQNRSGNMDYMLNPKWYWEDADNQMENNTPYVNIDTWNVAKVDLIPYEIKNIKWGNLQIRSLNFHNDYLCSQISNRYAMLNNRTRSRNIVLDATIPKQVIDMGFNDQSLKDHFYYSHGSVISPWFAELTGLEQIPTEELCAILGYSVDDIKTILETVKQRGMTAYFIGYGGTNVNTIHWITELCKMTEVYHPFYSAHIFEPDNLEISNLFRFPKSSTGIMATNGISKLSLLSREERDLLSTYTYTSTSYFELQTSLPANYVLYGAPDIATRQNLSKLGNFVSATHSNNECSLHLNPEQDRDLQIETYGTINLNTFFMNQLRMAIGFLEFLASKPDLTEKDKTIMDFSFDKESVRTSKRTYRFKLTPTPR